MPISAERTLARPVSMRQVVISLLAFCLLCSFGCGQAPSHKQEGAGSAIPAAKKAASPTKKGAEAGAPEGTETGDPGKAKGP